MSLSYQKARDYLVDRLLEQSWITEQDKREIRAAVSHWLQSPVSELPFFTNSMRQTCLQYIPQLATVGSEYHNVDHVAETYALMEQVFLEFIDIPYNPPVKWNFTFIDLFAGIGGFRIAFQNAGGKCVFSSEWDKYAQKTYEANFGEVPYGDICLINKAEIPDHDILCAGFPCQPFSLAGVSKKNSLGKKHGFEDETQGTLFFQIKEILRVKRPKAFMLENVPNLLWHDKGATFEVIRHTLEDILQYTIAWQIVDGSQWVPQNRKRVFIVGYDPLQVDIEKDEIVIPAKPKSGYKYPELHKIISPDIEGYTLGPGTWNTLVRHKAHHAASGNGFGYGLHQLPIKKGEITRTISARYHKDGAEILIEQKGDRPRRLTVAEAMQLQGYDPERFLFPVSNTQAYKQIGNSVVVPAVAATAQEIARTLQRTS